MDNYLWGIDLGGTKIEGVVLDKKDILSPLARERIDTNASKGYQNILENIKSLIGLLKQKTGLTPSMVGFGTPGIMDPESGLMKNCNTICLNGKNLKSDLEKALNLKVMLANDANCFALAEALYGAGKGSLSVFGVILGTGVGGGIVIDGKVIHGAQGIAGEWGHNILIQDGEPCYCGKKGCVEKVISGPALEEYYFKLSNKKLSLCEILNLKDKDSELVISRLCEYFGKAIATVINILDPEIVVIGGGLSNIQELYTRSLTSLSENIFNNKVQTKILKNKLGDSAGVFGAALLTMPRN